MWTLPRALLSLLAVPFVWAACSDSGQTSGTGTGSTTGSGGGAPDSSSSGFGTGGSGGCVEGQPCKGGTCIGGACCASSSVCGTACCGAGDVCSFQKCVTPGADCHDSSDCGPNQYCEYALNGAGTGGSGGGMGCMGGAALPTGKCLPQPPTCMGSGGQGGGGGGDGTLTCLEACEYHPVGTFNPVLKAAWGGMLVSPFSTDVMMAPIVMVLADTNCNGKIDAQDIPDILFTSFTGGNYSANGTLHAIRMENGNLVDVWSATGVTPGSQLAAGNIDGMPGNEVIACGDGGVTKAFKGDGTPLWTAPFSCYMPSIADLDGDGHVEVIVEGGILDGATGALKHAFAPALDTHFVVSDLDGDGKLDIITSDRGYHGDGTLFVDSKLGGSWPAVADFDHDGKPEVVLVDTTAHTVALWKYDATQPNSFKVVRAPVDMNSQFASNHCAASEYGFTHGGGPPTVADFNGDGTPDVGLAGGIGYIVFNGSKLTDPVQTGPQTILWSSTTTDCSSAQTGSSVFDFQGTGKAQVVYSDEEHLRIYDGTTGSVLFQTCNTTGTLVEFPIVADVDNDGHADIVVVSNAYASGNPEYQCSDGGPIAQAGVRVFGDANGTWVRTPPVWNEHAYHVTNISPDGSVPQNELPNYTQMGLNNFRQNKQPGSEFAAPDLVVSIAPSCPGAKSLVATVRNIGQAAVPAGVVIGFYEGAVPGTLLGQGTTTYPLYPAQAEDVVFTLTNPDTGLTSGTTPVYAVADDGMPTHPSWHECRTDNNTSPPEKAVCSAPQ